jgi:cytidyltransferase-like protein
MSKSVTNITKNSTKAIEIINTISKDELQNHVDHNEKISDLMKIFCTKRIKSHTALLRRLMIENIDISKYHKDLPFINKQNGKLFIYDGYYEYKTDKVFIYYKAKCFCGNDKLILSNHIHSTLDCGCIKSGQLIGKKYNQLTIVEPIQDTNFKQYLCKCDCGKDHECTIFDVIRGKVKTCGHAQKARGRNNSRFKGVGDIPAAHWHSILSSARQRGIDVQITLEDIWSLFLEQEGKCSLTNIPLFFAETAKDKSLKTASLDRVDSNKEYTIDNVQWVHKIINYMKMTTNQETFIEFCRLVSENHPKVVVINSGFYNCLHTGHISCFQASKLLGNKLVAIVNNDLQVQLKGSKVFMNENERLEIVKALRGVDDSFIAIDDDITVLKSLEFIAKKYKYSKLVFAKGGDRKDNSCMPNSELDICNRLGIEIRYGVGGFDKKNSSSSILRNMV